MADIRSGMTSLQLMRKYELSPKALQSVYSKLIAAKLLDAKDFPAKAKTRTFRDVAAPKFCPSCGIKIIHSEQECAGCGVIFAKLKPQQEVGSTSPSEYHEADKATFAIPRQIRAPESPNHPLAETTFTAVNRYSADEDTNLEIRKMDKDEWIMVSIGIGVALLGMVFFWLGWTLVTFKILVHEMGHAIFGWLFAYPSIPAFDMLHGGGITLHIERSTFLLASIYIGIAWLIYVYRKNIHAVLFLIAISIIHVILSLTVWHSVLIVFMGHGFELIIATLFIYRALSARSIIHTIERPMYSIIGFYIFFYDLVFAYKMLTNLSYEAEYLDSKDGDIDPDFLVIAREHLGVSMRSVVFFFLFCCFLPPVVSFLCHRYEQHIHSAIITLLKRDPASDQI